MAKVRSTRSAILLKRARTMRRDLTYAEAKLWQQLRRKRLGEWKWRRHEPVGAYIADFVCYRARLIVEVDGDVHDAQADRDLSRTIVLDTFGFRVLRFTNDQVLADIGGVCARILAACGGDARPLTSAAAPRSRPPPTPLPVEGGA